MSAKQKEQGFTIVELLIVIVVIAIVGTISFTTYTGIQGRARDTVRLAQMKEFANAFELYKLDNGTYPQIEDGGSFESACGSQIENWGHCDRLKQLADNLAPYMKIDPASMSNAAPGSYGFYYNSSYVDGFQSYGMWAGLESGGGQNDGGYHPWAYEIGPDPAYCMQKYSGTNAQWLWTNARTRCVGGP